MRGGFISGAMVLALLASAAGAAETVARTYAIPGDRVLNLHLPGGWSDEVAAAEGSNLPAVTLKPATGHAFSANVTVRFSAPPGATGPSDGRIRLLVEQQAQKMAASVGVAAGPLGPIDGTQASGYYFSITDPRYKAGEYRHLTSGVVVLGGVTASFDVFTNEAGQGVVKDMLAVIRGATVTESRSVQAIVGPRVTVADVTIRQATAAETRVLQRDVSLLLDVAAGRSTDIDSVVRLTYPKVLAMGGEVAVRRALQEAGQQVQRLGMSIESRGFQDPPMIIIGAQRSYAIVPTHAVMAAGDTRVESYNFQFGVREQSAVTWTYLEGSRINSDMLAEWFPDFPADYRFPRVSREKL